MKTLLNGILAHAPTVLLIASVLALLFIPHTYMGPITPIDKQFKHVATELWPPSSRPPAESSVIYVDVQLSDGPAPLVTGGQADQHAFEDTATKECAQLLKTIANSCRLKHIYFTGGTHGRGQQVFARYLIEPKRMTPPAH